MLRFAANGLFSFSSFPLHFPAYLGAAVLMGTLLAGGASLASWMLWPAAGWWTSPGVLAMLFVGAVQLVSLGVIGEYLARIYDEVRGRPRWIVRTTTDELDRAEPKHPAAEDVLVFAERIDTTRGASIPACRSRVEG